MSQQQYSPKSFLRQVPKELLKFYFTQRGLLTALPWEALDEGEIDPIYEAWQQLPEQDRDQAEADFQAIDDIATSEGIIAIIEESQFHGHDLGSELEALEGFHHKAFWTFLEHPKVFSGASLLDQVDHMSNRYRYRRKGILKCDPDISQAAREELKQRLSAYYQAHQSRGRRCTLELYLRCGRYHYVFAYLEDYADTFIGYDHNGKLRRRPQRPAFELVFIYDPVDGTLDVYAPGSKQLKIDLQPIFCSAFLKQELDSEPRGAHSYELNPLKERFPFPTDPEDGILDVRVKKLRLSVVGESLQRITLEGNTKYHREDVYDLMDKALSRERLPLSQVNITQATIQMLFSNGDKRPKSVTFNVSYPNYCNLKDTPEHRKANAYLKRWGIALV